MLSNFPAMCASSLQSSVSMVGVLEAFGRLHPCVWHEVHWGCSLLFFLEGFYWLKFFLQTGLPWSDLTEGDLLVLSRTVFMTLLVIFDVFDCWHLADWIWGWVCSV